MFGIIQTDKIVLLLKLDEWDNIISWIGENHVIAGVDRLFFLFFFSAAFCKVK